MERPPDSDFSETEQALIAKLREKGVDDPETHELLVRWCKGEETKANAINTARANIELDLKKARLYRAAGYYDDAWASLEAVRQAAHGEGAEDLRSQAEAIMDQIDEEFREEER